MTPGSVQNRNMEIKNFYFFYFIFIFLEILLLFQWKTVTETQLLTAWMAEDHHRHNRFAHNQDSFPQDITWSSCDSWVDFRVKYLSCPQPKQQTHIQSLSLKCSHRTAHDAACPQCCSGKLAGRRLSAKHLVVSSQTHWSESKEGGCINWKENAQFFLLNWCMTDLNRFNQSSP